MLTGLSIRDVVLVEALDLDVGAGLTVLTGETGAGKSIILDALGLTMGARAEAGLVRAGAERASAVATFAAPFAADLIALLDEKGVDVPPGDDLILRRVLGADGRSRAFVNDQAVGVTTLREIGAALIEVHGQHETVGLLDWRTHRGLLDGFGGLAGEVEAVRAASEALRAAEARLADLQAAAADAEVRREELARDLAELDQLDPRADEEEALSGERAVLGAAEKALEDLSDARAALGGDKLSQKLASALRAVDHAGRRARQAGVGEGHPVLLRLTAAAEAIDRTLIEAAEAVAQVDAAADAFDFEPGRLDKAEERLFALRAAARRLRATVDQLPALRVQFREKLALLDGDADALTQGRRAASAAREAWDAAAATLSAARAASARRLEAAVASELGPLKLERAQFRVVLDPVADDRRGPNGRETVRFEVATNAGQPFGPLDSVASGGELARFALAMKAALAGRAGGDQPVMIFDEVDQGVGGAVAEAVGRRLRRLAEGAQVIVVTHSPQVAAMGQAHWKVGKAEAGGQVRTSVAVLDAAQRDEEIARMLSGAVVTDEARAAARALRA
ncbi:MAG: DNA repair protein RecN [Caulobacteraceae bacterium]|nr:DNA repair protein RecN [Caulobacteraceae bacterium]